MAVNPQPQAANGEYPKQRSYLGFLVFSLVLMFMLSLAILLPLHPNDFFPYLRIGEEILKTGSIPTTEFMTYTRYGEPAVYLYWIPSLLFLKSYQWGGFTLVGIMAAVCIASFYTLLWLCLRELKIKPVISGFVLLLTAVVGINDWSVRPQLLTYPLFGLALLVILRWQKQDNRWLWVLPVIAMLWANFHGSFIVLFLVLLPALLFGCGDRKRLLICILLTLGATCINRFGYHLWENMFSMVNSSSIKNFSLEWQPPANDNWQSAVFFATLLAIPALTAVARPKFNLFYWVWFIGFGWMALSAVRYEAWFLPVETLILGMLLNPLADRFAGSSSRFQNRTVNLVLGILLLLCPVALLPGIRGLWWQQAPPVLNETAPVAATEWLKKNPQLPGELWSDFSYSTYLTYELQERKLFTTNRFEDFTEKQLTDNQHIARADADWQELLDQYGVNLILLSKKTEPDLLDAASASKEWKEVYRDEQSVLFTRIMD